MRKVKNIEIYNVVESINQFYETVTGDIPICLSYAISKHTKTLETHLKEYMSARDLFCKKYALKNENGEPMTQKIQNVDGSYVQNKDGSFYEEYCMEEKDKVEFNEEVKVLNEAEVEVPDYKINISSITDLKFDPRKFTLYSIFMDYFIE